MREYRGAGTCVQQGGPVKDLKGVVQLDDEGVVDRLGTTDLVNSVPYLSSRT